MVLTIEVVMISRRNRCPRSVSGNRSRSADGKYVSSSESSAGSSGRSVSSTSVMSAVLGVGDHHRELGSAQPAAGALALGDLLVAGKELQLPIEEALGLERVEVPRMHVHHPQRLLAGDHQRERLAPVVLQHEFGDVIGHLGEQRVALLGRELAVVHQLVEGDLDVDFVVAAVDAGRIVDRVGVDRALRRARTRCGPAG